MYRIHLLILEVLNLQLHYILGANSTSSNGRAVQVINKKYIQFGGSNSNASQSTNRSNILQQSQVK